MIYLVYVYFFFNGVVFKLEVINLFFLSVVGVKVLEREKGEKKGKKKMRI